MIELLGSKIPKVLNRFLRAARRSENRMRVVNEDFEPSRDIGSMILSRLIGYSERGAHECRTKLGNELLKRVRLNAVTLADFPSNAMVGSSPVTIMPISA